jgi:ribosomal protein L37E
MSNNTDEMSRWMVWYKDKPPVGVLAPNRSAAASIGDSARPDAIPTTIVGEDDGDLDDLSDFTDEQLSTEDNPTRFLHVLEASAGTGEVDASCSKCGEQEWQQNQRFGGIECASCGWMPRKERRERIKKVI